MKKIFRVPFNAADACKFAILMTALPLAGVTVESTGRPAELVPRPTVTSHLLAVVICEFVKVNV